MGLRRGGFRERAKEQKDDLADRHQESYDRKDERTSLVGSVFDQNLIKELEIEIWRPDIGDHIVDVVPFYAGKQHPDRAEGEMTYLVDFWAHQRIGQMNDFFVCQTSTFKLPDPICQYISKYRPPEPEWKKIRPVRRCAYLVWVHDNEEEEAKGIQLFEVAHWFFENNVASIARKPRGGGAIAFSHPDSGRHVFWTVAKTGSFEDDTGTKRDSMGFIGFQLVERDVPKIPDDILNQSFALDEIIKMHPSEEEVLEAFYGSSGKPEDTEPETEGRTPKKSALDRAREKKEKGKTDADTEPETEKETPDDTGQETERDIKPETKTKPDDAASDEGTEYTCPYAEIGGEFGETIETLSECDDCEIYEECADEEDKRRKAKREDDKSTGKDEKEKGKLVRR